MDAVARAVRRLLDMPNDSVEFFELAHEVMLAGNRSQQRAVLRLIGEAMGDVDVRVTDAMIEDYLSVHRG